MEGAFGADLGHVRVHNDAHASGLSQRFGASAFAVGNHIAFRQGTFRPGTLSGDGLIAHEVAHTLQQRDASTPAETGTYDRAESESAAATPSAVGRLTGLPGAGKGSPIPLGPTGLSLQRCDGSRFDQPGPEPAMDTTSGLLLHHPSDPPSWASALSPLPSNFKPPKAETIQEWNPTLVQKISQWVNGPESANAAEFFAQRLVKILWVPLDMIQVAGSSIDAKLGRQPGATHLGGEIADTEEVKAAWKWLAINLVILKAVPMFGRVTAEAGLSEEVTRISSQIESPATEASPKATTSSGADNAATYPKLKTSLMAEEASSVFDETGGLKPEFIQSSREIIPGSDLKNPAVVQELTKDGSNINDWGKFSTPTLRSPSGDYQVHFYYNRTTGQISRMIDYKIKFN
jgi:hypothetical protein